VFKELLDYRVVPAADSTGKIILEKAIGITILDGGSITSPYEQAIYHLSPFFKISLLYNTLKP
jgi:hypothetical protein